jgi:hypothetical protein
MRRSLVFIAAWMQFTTVLACGPHEPPSVSYPAPGPDSGSTGRAGTALDVGVESSGANSQSPVDVALSVQPAIPDAAMSAESDVAPPASLEDGLGHCMRDNDCVVTYWMCSPCPPCLTALRAIDRNSLNKEHRLCEWERPGHRIVRCERCPSYLKENPAPVPTTAVCKNRRCYFSPLTP